MTDTDHRVRRALEGESDGLHERVLPLDDLEILSRAKGGDGRTVVAYAAAFGRQAEIHDQDGHYTEENHPQAFHKSVAERGLRFGVFYHHAKTLHGTPSERGSVPLGRPVLVKPDGNGLLTHTAYNRNQLADEVLESIHNGDPMGMSFTGAYLQSDPPRAPYYSRSDGSLTHVVRKEIALIEYGPTPIPAYADAAILGVRAAQQREAAGGHARADAGQPYQRQPDEDVQCPACGKYNDDDAVFCDQCGQRLPDSAFPEGHQTYERDPGEDVQCPSCGKYNMPDAVFCDQCGAELPPTAFEGIAAGMGAGTTSSSGRQPQQETSERSEPPAPEPEPEAAPQPEPPPEPEPQPEPAPAPAEPVAAASAGHERAASVDNSAWDAAKAWANGAASDDPAAFYNGICAGKKAGDPKTQAAHALPYKYTPSSPPNAAGVKNALSRLPQTDGLTNASEAKATLQRLMKQVSPDYEPDDSGSAMGGPGRSETTPAAEGTGAGEAAPAAPAPTGEPHTHSTAATTEPSKEGTTVEPTIAERAARRSEIEGRLAAIHTEHGETELPAEIQAEWDTLSTELDTHSRALDEHERALTSRRERVAAIAARQEGEKVSGERSGYTAPNGDRTAPAFHREQGDDLYDVRAVRQRGLSLDDAALAYRERALRIVEKGSFPGSEDKERSQSTVERLLHSIDDEEGTLAQRVMLTGSPVYMRAWGKTMARMSPMGLTPEEMGALERGRALAVGTGSAGGFAVPFQLDPTVILTSNGAINPLRQISRVQTITGKEYDLVTSAGVTVSRSAEGAAMSDNTPTLAQPTIKANRVTGFIPFSMEIEQDWNALQSEMMMLLADAKDVEESASFTNGDGTGTNAGGIIGTLSTASNVAGGTTATLAASDLYNLEDAIPPRFRPRANWMASKTTYNAYRQLFTGTASAAGDPWVRPTQGTPAELLGYPAYEDSDMVTTHASNDRVIVLGDFGRGFIIIDRVGMSTEIAPVLFDQATGRPTGQRGLIAFWRNNIRVLVDNAFRVIKVL